MDLPALRVMWLYPDHMNIYADRGNIAVLEHRCRWRGIGFELGTAGPGDSIDPAAHDLYYMGGGQDRDQALVTRDLADTKRDALAEAAATGASFLAVCGGYQLLLVDLRTVREPGERLIGNVLIDADLGNGTRRLAGFENHGGRTYLGPGEQPLGRVVSGFGNNGKDGAEGVRRGKVIGTYLHGPLLPKNAWLADVLTAWALERRTGEAPELAPLDDALEDAAHESAVRAALRG
jgi:CobQ-like glutamine amidotransferase family enzyme